MPTKLFNGYAVTLNLNGKSVNIGFSVITKSNYWLTFNAANFYNTKKHVKHTVILKVNYACCVHITDFGLILYQRISALFTQETKAYIISFLLI